MTRIAFYSHDTLGLGHLRRCLKLADALRDSLAPIQGLLITGSSWTHLFAAPSGFDYLLLPSIVKRGRGYAPRVPGVELAPLLAARRDRIEAALDDFRPDLLLVDNVPCGLLGEVLPALRGAKSRSGSRCVLVLRDVLDRLDRVATEWRAVGAAEALETLYDEVWVFGDEAALVELAGLPGMSGATSISCGRLGLGPTTAGAVGTDHRPVQKPRTGSRPAILVACGGGADAEPLVRSYVEMLRTVKPDVSSHIVLGPDFPRLALHRITACNGFEARIDRFFSDLPSAMSRADLVVSMAGYNTVCELEEVGRRSVLVPRVWPRQEQRIRAAKQKTEGRASVLLPEELEPESLWCAMRSTLAQSPPAALRHTGGAIAAERAANLLARPLPRKEIPL